MQDELALSRGTVDRVTVQRADPDWVETAWQDPRTQVVVASRGRALVRDQDDGVVDLVFVPPSRAPQGVRFVLGQDADGG